MNPKISIIIPVYNSSELLGKCIDSILSQTFNDFECILVDDFSSDLSYKICHGYSLKDKRIRIFHNNQNYGSSISRRIGLEQSLGKYILFVDSDDWIEPFMLEKMYIKSKVEDLDIVFCDYYYEENNITTYKKQEIECKSKIEIMKNMAAYNEKLNCSLWNKLIRKKKIENVIFPMESYSEDMYISTQILYFSEKIGCINEPLYHYVYNASSLCYNEKYIHKRIVENYQICFLINQFLKEKFGENLDSFEPELSERFNKAKLRFLSLQHDALEI